MLAICKHLDYKKINMNLNYSIFSYLIPDNTFVHLFDNIDDRI